MVAYYFPPMGLSGVQRVAKFVKYLPLYGWDVTVLTVEPGGYFAFDEGLLDEVQKSGAAIVRTASTDPTRLFGKRRVAMPAEGRRKVFSLISQALFIPDNKIGWRRPALQAGHEVLSKERFDLVLSSAPPYTGHLVGMDLAARFDLPLVTDFRDDWLENPRHTYPTGLHRARHRDLERRVIARSRFVTTINPVIADAIRSRHKDISDRVHVIEQGFDPDDYPTLSTAWPEAAAGTSPAGTPLPSGVPSTVSGTTDGNGLAFVYTGVFYDAQTPATFLEGLARFRALHPESRVRALFFGLFPEEERQRVDRLGLADCVTIGPYLTHRDAMKAVSTADVPWLVVGRREGAEQISTGKLYAYVGARKPILALVPEGAAREALVEYGAVYLADPDDAGSVADAMARIYADFSTGAHVEASSAFVERHDRRKITGRLAQLMHEASDRA